MGAPKFSAHSSRLALAEASLRLRGKPGRPRKAPVAGAEQATAPSGATSAALRDAVLRGASDAVPKIVPARLLDLEATAAYLSVSPWTVRDLEAAGTLRRVRVPSAQGGDLRRLLFDRQDLDRLVEVWKT